MKRSLHHDLPHLMDQRVCVRGWLHTFRSLGKLNFLILRDRTGLTQIVVEDRQIAKQLASLQPGSILRVEGIVARSGSQQDGVEIVHPTITIEEAIHAVPPVEYYKPVLHQDLDFLLDHRPIALRNQEQQAIFRIQAAIAHAYRLYMHDTIGAVEYFAPNILGASSEGGAEFFHVDYFGHVATLAQSSQLYKQIMVGVNERVFALMPFFRAEPSHTSRHLSEGKQFEFEMGFFDHWHDLLDIQEGVVHAILDHVRTTCSQELAILGHPLITCPSSVRFPRLTFYEAQNLYFARTGIDERSEPDLSPAAEKNLCQWALEVHGTQCLFITDWKVEKRPFYSYPSPENPDLTHTFDLLCAGTEITSGGQRRHTYDSMLEGLRLKGMNPDNFTDYLSIFQYGMPPHGGFGMGFERLTMTLLQRKNIREVSLFPSDTKRIAGNRIKAHIFFGSENIRNEIIRRFKEAGQPFTHLIHEATTTSQESAQVRDTALEEGIKSILVRGKTSKKNVQFNIPAHMKLDIKACAERMGEKCEFESPEVILERFGLPIGGIPPFGNLLNLDTYFDERIFLSSRVAFNCGFVTESIITESAGLLSLTAATIGQFAKE